MKNKKQPPENAINGQYPISIIIPVYNEEKAIAETVLAIRSSLERAGFEFEIIVVDDASSDGTAEKLRALEQRNLIVLKHRENRGYGAALKTGLAASSHDVLAIIDADGTYPAEGIPNLANRLGILDMVVGSRTKKSVRIPLVRRPPKWIIGKLANYLTRTKIPDLNSGLRVFRKSALERYTNLLPDGFSFTTTITIAMLVNGHDVAYVPIEYARRVGKSKVRPIHDTLNFVQLIIRTILLFEPLRIFLPAAALMLLAAVGVFSYSLFCLPHILDTTVTLLVVGAIQMLAIGMIADMINRRLDR